MFIGSSFVALVVVFAVSWDGANSQDTFLKDAAMVARTYGDAGRENIDRLLGGSMNPGSVFNGGWAPQYCWRDTLKQLQAKCPEGSVNSWGDLRKCFTDDVLDAAFDCASKELGAAGIDGGVAYDWPRPTTIISDHNTEKTWLPFRAKADMATYNLIIGVRNL